MRKFDWSEIATLLRITKVKFLLEPTNPEELKVMHDKNLVPLYVNAEDEGYLPKSALSRNIPIVQAKMPHTNRNKAATRRDFSLE